MNSHPTFRAVALTLASLLVTFTGCSTPPQPPNIVVILADDMGFSDLGCYGGEIDTPNLDSLARDGLRFTQFYNTSKCFPSRACLLTGAYAQQVGMARKPGAIKNGTTLGAVLRSAGYRTLMTGKHHGTQNPVDLGFDRYFGLRDGGCNYFNPGKQRAGEPKPAQKRNTRAWCIDDKTYQPFTPEDPKFYTTDAFTDYALRYLDEYQAEDKPFFLYLAYNAPHDPLQAWPKDIAKYAAAYESGWAATRARRFERQRRLGLVSLDARPSDPTHGDWNTLTPKQRATESHRMAVYAAMVDRLDQNVGRLIAKLDSLGEFENTLILFASDNGGSAEVVRKGTGEIGSMTRWSSLKGDWANVSNTPFRRFKNHSHEGGICTPLIVHWPRMIRGERRGNIVRTPSHFIDVMATCVELSGATYPETIDENKIAPMQGESLGPVIRGESWRRQHPLYWQWRRGRAMRDGAWKIVKHGAAWELYDMRVDRIESRNLAELHPERVEAMRSRFADWWDGLPKQ